MGLPNLVGKGPIFTPKWTTTWHHSMRDASLNTHLQSFDGPLIESKLRVILSRLARFTAKFMSKIGYFQLGLRTNPESSGLSPLCQVGASTEHHSSSAWLIWCAKMAIFGFFLARAPLCQVGVFDEGRSSSIQIGPPDGSKCVFNEALLAPWCHALIHFE